MRSPLLRAALRGAVCLLAFAAASAGRAEDEKPAAAPAVDSAARKVIEDWGKYAVALKRFSVTIDAQVEVSQDGNVNTLEVSQELKAERPNKLAFAIESANGGGSLFSDGKEVSIYLVGFGKYLVEEAPATWEGIFQNPLATGIISPGNATAITSALLADDPAAKLLASVESAKYGGSVMLDDVKCHLIEAVGKDLEWKLWIDASQRPLVRQFVPDLEKFLAKKGKLGKGAAGLANVKVTDIVKYKDWQLDPTLAADTFVFNVPDGAVKAESVADMIGRPRGAEGGPHPLLAKDAPPVKLDLLGGGKLDLGALRTKNVVILDFWATWCGPCQEAMPIIEKVAEEYKAKGVLLYAVNIEETPEDVKKFADDSGLHVAIALDTDGAVARAYQANAIPQTVLVGKDGTVQVVHVGLSPDLESQLKTELDALVAGKDLAAEAKAGKEKSPPPAAAARKDEK